MAAINFILRKDKTNANGECPLYITQSSGKRRKWIYTKINLLPSQWDEKKKRVIKHNNALAFNNFLKAEEIEFEKKVILSQNVDLYIKEQTEKCGKINFIEFALEIITEKLSHKKIKKSTYNRISHFIKMFNGFSPNTRIKDIDENVIKSYIKYRSHLSQNSLAIELFFFKMIIKTAIKKKLLIEDPFENLSIPNRVKTERSFLTQIEVNFLREQFLKSEPKTISQHKYKITLAYFLFACYVGLRYSDLVQLDFQKIYNEKYINFTTKKTTEQLKIKIPQDAFPILEFLLQCKQSRRERLLHSLQLYNTRLKPTMKYFGLNKNVSSHCARHTFAMRMAEMGVSIEVASAVLGHTDIKTTGIYYKIGNKRINNEMEKFGF